MLEINSASHSSTLSFLIPAYNPTQELLQLVNNLARQAPDTLILVVNDGSSAQSDDVFLAIPHQPSVHLVTHELHSGKGQALKTGIEYVARHYPSCTHIVTADADGQHTVQDILAVGNEAQLWREHVVLGTRTFNGDVPTRSWIGNTIISALFGFCTGLKLQDTQTGLRALPIEFGLRCLTIPASGYDFEMAMLIECHALNVTIKEIAITTIYIEGNRHSHFNPLIDSLKVCRVIIQSAVSSCKDMVIRTTAAFLPWCILSIHVTRTRGRRNALFQRTAGEAKNVIRRYW